MDALSAVERLSWTDREVLEFMGVALRNVDIVGSVRISEIRQGLEMYSAGPAGLSVVVGRNLIGEQVLEDLASSACQEALSFGVSEEAFARLARTVELRARKIVAPLLAEIEQLKVDVKGLRDVAEVAAKKLRSAEICHPNAVDHLIGEARSALSDHLPKGWPVRQ
jgi:hypothetical protein